MILTLTAIIPLQNINRSVIIKNEDVFCTMTNKCTQLFHKLSHCYMFRQYRAIFRQLVINNLPSYTSISNAAVGNKDVCSL